MNAVPPTLTITWRHALAAVILVELALLGIYYDTGLAMMRIWWRSETFNHAFLVPLIVFWLVWEKRHVLARQHPRPSPWLALPLAGLAFAWLLGELAAVNAVTQLAFTAMLVLAVPLVIGLPAARQIAFPLGFLFFAVPLGEFVMPTLMDWTATFTVLGLRASGIPVYQEGLHFVIPSGRWSVVEACSGVRYLIASIVVGTLFAYLNYHSLKRRLIFIGVAIVVPLIANWVRAYIIVMLGHLSGNEIATGADHLIYGWVFFGVVIMIMFAIGMRWRESEAGLPPIVEAERSRGLMASGRPAGLAIAALLALGIALAPRAALMAMDAGPELPPPVLSPQPLAADGWQIVADPITDWRPAFDNPSATSNVVLARGDRRIGVFIHYYRQQNYARKLISSDNVLVKSEDKGWAQVSRDARQATLAGQPLAVRSGSLRSNLAGIGADPFRLKVWHWYWIGGRLTISEPLGKVWLALARLTGQGDDSAAVFIYAPEPDAETVLSDYLASAGGGIAAMLENARVQK